MILYWTTTEHVCDIASQIDLPLADVSVELGVTEHVRHVNDFDHIPLVDGSVEL